MLSVFDLSINFTNIYLSLRFPFLPSPISSQVMRRTRNQFWCYRLLDDLSVKSYRWAHVDCSKMSLVDVTACLLAFSTSTGELLLLQTPRTCRALHRCSRGMIDLSFLITVQHPSWNKKHEKNRQESSCTRTSRLWYIRSDVGLISDHYVFVPHARCDFARWREKREIR